MSSGLRSQREHKKFHLLSIPTCCTFKTEKGLEMSWMFWKHRGRSVLPRSPWSPGLRGLPCLFIIILPPLGTASQWSQEGSIGMVAPHWNQLFTSSQALTSPPGLWMGLIFHDELPRTNEEERGWWGQERERGRLKEKIQEEFFALTPSGCSACWRSTVHFSGKCISSLPPTQISQTEWSPCGGVP